jgi:hypothetical protein
MNWLVMEKEFSSQDGKMKNQLLKIFKEKGFILFIMIRYESLAKVETEGDDGCHPYDQNNSNLWSDRYRHDNLQTLNLYEK